jgi:hypothetical protein
MKEKVEDLDRIEPLHEMEPDELCHGLDMAWEYLEFIFTEETSPEDVNRIGEIPSGILSSIIHSLKKSLLYFYPDRSKEIIDLSTVNEATKYKYLLIGNRESFTPLNEGVEGLVKMYSWLGPYRGTFPLPENEFESEKADFISMNLALKNYFILARKEYLRSLKKTTSSKGGKKPKRLPGILLAVKEMVQDPDVNSFSAERLWKRFEQRHEGKKKAMKIKGFKIFFNGDNPDGEGRLYQEPSDKDHNFIGRSAFNGYVKEAKQNLK